MPRGVEVKLNTILTSALDEWSASRSGRIILGKRATANQWTGGWLDGTWLFASLHFLPTYSQEYRHINQFKTRHKQTKSSCRHKNKALQFKEFALT
jgi:hypothetical protein